MHLSGRGNSECAVKENYGAIVAQKLRNPILDHTHSKIRNPIRDGEMPCLGNSSQYFPRWAEHIVNECQSQKGRPRFAALQVNDSSTRNWVGRLSEAEFHACAGCPEPPIQSRYVSPMRALCGTHTDHEIVKKMEHIPSQLIPRDFAGVDSKKAIVNSTKEYVPKWLKDREEAVSNKEIELKKAWDDYKYRLQDILRREERLKLRELAVVNTAEKHGLAWHCDLVARESQVQIKEELLGERKVQILEELNDFRKNILQELEVAMKTLSQVINNSTTSLREVNSSQPSEFDGLEKSGSITRAAPTFYDNQSVTKLLTTVILENAPKLASPKRPQQTKANAAMPSQRKENDFSSAVFTNGIDADESLDEEGYEALVRKVDHQISERTKENCDELAILHREENLMLREQQLRALTQYLKKQRADTQEEKLRLQERLARVAVLEERVRNAAAKIRGEVPVISSSQRLHRLLMDQLNRRQEREQQIVGNQSRCDTL